MPPTFLPNRIPPPTCFFNIISVSKECTDQQSADGYAWPAAAADSVVTLPCLGNQKSGAVVRRQWSVCQLKWAQILSAGDYALLKSIQNADLESARASRTLPYIVPIFSTFTSAPHLSHLNINPDCTLSWIRYSKPPLEYHIISDSLLFGRSFWV